MTPNPQGLELFTARQQRKRHLAAVWARLAGLQSGMVVLDIGCGLGILTQEYARLVGPAGKVYGVEQSAALAVRLQAEKTGDVRFLFQNYDAEFNLEQTPDIVFLTDTLHHVADPPAVLARIFAVCGARSRVFIAEYDPQGPGVVGAKLHRRIGKARLLGVVEAAGLKHDGIIDSEDEHYTLSARC